MNIVPIRRTTSSVFGEKTSVFHQIHLPLNRRLRLLGKALLYLCVPKAFPSDPRERFRGRWPSEARSEEVGSG